MGCRAPPEGDVFNATSPWPAIITHSCTPAVRPSSRDTAASGTASPPKRRQVRRATDIGYRAMAGSELEYYIFNNSYRQAAVAGYTSLESAGWYLEDYHVLQGTREESLNAAVRRVLHAAHPPQVPQRLVEHVGQGAAALRDAGVEGAGVRREVGGDGEQRVGADPRVDDVLVVVAGVVPAAGAVPLNVAAADEVEIGVV